jgi:hypothetical protein
MTGRCLRNDGNQQKHQKADCEDTHIELGVFFQNLLQSEVVGFSHSIPLPGFRESEPRTPSPDEEVSYHRNSGESHETLRPEFVKLLCLFVGQARHGAFSFSHRIYSLMTANRPAPRRARAVKAAAALRHDIRFVQQG